MDAKIKFRAGELEMEAEGESYFVSENTKAVLEYLKCKAGAVNTEIPVPQEIIKPVIEAGSSCGVKEETVVIYDDAGIPSIMRKFSRVTNAELFGGSDKPHPAFVIGGEVYDEIYISVYPNCNINGKPYSLPFQKLWTDITNDDAAKACFSKGEGWHLMTAVEWGLIANICAKNGTLPHGNTDYGKYHADGDEKGVTYNDGGKTLAGSGPATWTHNHQPDGVHDLCGNVWEMLRGLRIKDGQLQKAQDNDAAMDIDLSESSEKWLSVSADDGKAVYVSVNDGIRFTTDDGISQDYEGCAWEDVEMDCDSEQLKALALYNGEEKAYCWIDSTDGEYFPIRGGDWHCGANAGVFNVSLISPRAYSFAHLGFRSAYYKKH